MDRIHSNLVNDDVKFKVWKNNVIYLGEFTFGIWLVEPGGQVLLSLDSSISISL